MTIAATSLHPSSWSGGGRLARKICAAGVVLILIAFASTGGYAIEATAPKLGSEPAPAANGDTDPAQPLPMTVTICVDRSARRCWTGAATEQCKPFATLPANSPDLGKQLRACWDSVAE